ncbi:MAG: gliding motility lipoprotein GldD [Bacteroidales bacterium]|nr:gliding motility lipoprotein GldD [Bacteroidales bacterium]
MKSKIAVIITIAVVLLAILGACGGKNYAPRPKGYFRIDFPEKTYKQYNGECPFKFEIPEYSFLIKEKEDNCWFDIYFPSYKATVYLTYRSVNNDIDTLLNDAHDFAYKHTIKADAIEENIFEKDSSRVFGCLYNIKGNVASQVQFYLTDSTTHFMRGSLYFEAHPNKDSLAPVVDFIRDDIEHFMESFEWR